MLATVTAAATAVAVSIPARAAGPPATTAAGSSLTQSDLTQPDLTQSDLTQSERRSAEAGQERITEAVRRLQPYVHRTAAGTFRIQAPADVVAAIPPGAYAAVMESSRLVNLDITAGRLVSRADGRILPARTLIAPGATVRADGTVLGHLTARAAQASGSRSGQLSRAAVAAGTSPVAEPNTLTVQWWGVQIHLNKASATALIGALQGFATVSAVIGVLITAGLISSPVGVPLAIVGGILTVVTAALAACRTDRGLNLYLTWIVFGWCAKP